MINEIFEIIVKI